MGEKISLVVARDVREYREYELDVDDVPERLRATVLEASRIVGENDYCDRMDHGGLVLLAADALRIYGRMVGANEDDSDAGDTLTILPAWGEA